MIKHQDFFTSEYSSYEEEADMMAEAEADRIAHENASIKRRLNMVIESKFKKLDEDLASLRVSISQAELDVIVKEFEDNERKGWLNDKGIWA